METRALQRGEGLVGVLGQQGDLIFLGKEERGKGKVAWRGDRLDLHRHCLGTFDGQLGGPFVVVGVVDEDLIQQVGCNNEKVKENVRNFFEKK